jgi:hypothetical protein
VSFSEDVPVVDGAIDRNRGDPFAEFLDRQNAGARPPVCTIGSWIDLVGRLHLGLCRQESPSVASWEEAGDESRLRSAIKLPQTVVAFSGGRTRTLASHDVRGRLFIIAH